MDHSDVIEDIIEGNIKVITYNKPKRKNAINPSMYERIAKIMNEAASDDKINMLVITGTGDYYSSGNDIKAAVEARNSLKEVLSNFIKAFITFPKLLVAIVNGPAIGIAATTLPLCDLVFAVENAFFYTPFTKLGIVAEACSSFTFAQLMGVRKAAEMLIFNHKMSATEALEHGFINYVFKPEELQTKVWNKIVEVSRLPQESVLATKKLMKANVDHLLSVNDRELAELEKLWTSDENIKIVNKFVSKSRSKI